MSMKHVPIMGKVLLLLSAFGLLAIGSAVFSNVQLRRVSSSYRTLIDNDGRAEINMIRANRSMATAEAAIMRLLIDNSTSGDAAAIAALKANRDSFSTYVGNAKAALPSWAARLDGLLQRGLTLLDKTCAKSIELGTNAKDPDANEASQADFLGTCGPAFGPLRQEFVADTDQLIAQADTRQGEVMAVVDTAVSVTYGGILGGLLLVGVGATFATRAWIGRPLQNLNGCLRRLAAGDLTQDVTGVERRDELGQMAQAVLVLKQASHEKISLEQEAAETRLAAENQRQAADAERAASAEAQTMVVATLADGLGKIAEGDLTCRIDRAFIPEYERLRSDYNVAVTSLHGLLQGIVANTGALRSGTGEIAQAAEDLSRRTEQQAASLEETAAALDEMTATVKRTAEGAVQARESVSRTRTDAEQSGDVVRKAVAAMGEIERSSNQIGQIIGVIDEIAFQTNLLALNAGVEAARAGDAGRGFAVVASEVRSLAQRSAQAAREIKALISASAQHVGEGVRLVGETGQALTRIVGQVGNVAAIVTEIAASAGEQATGLAEVNTAVNQMDQITQQNAAMVEQSAAASNTLARETEALAGLTDRFKIDAPAQVEASVKTVVPPRRVAANTSKAAPPRLSTVSSKPGRMAARRTAMPPRSNAALAVADAGWEEF